MAAEERHVSGNLRLELKGGFDHYPQNQHLVANAIRYFARAVIIAALFLLVGMIAAAGIVVGGLN